MSEARSANNDPSMDDILASIRKIISDDEARAQVGRQKAQPATAPGSAGSDDVLLLTNLIEEPKSAPVPVPRIDPAQASEMPQPPVEQPRVEPPRGDALVGSAFARLNQAVQESVPPPAAHEPGPSVDGNGKTIEDLVKEMLRPMLKEWLDRNLPPMVERFVEREIVRLTRR
jgi:cell pole-organizing protein PopZ